MTEEKEQQDRKKLSLKKPASKTPEGGDGGAVRQRSAAGRSHVVAVEVKRRRVLHPEKAVEGAAEPPATQEARKEKAAAGGLAGLRDLTSEEREARIRALRESVVEAEKRRAEEKPLTPEEAAVPKEKTTKVTEVIEETDLRRRELEELERIKEEERTKAEEAEERRIEEGWGKKRAPVGREVAKAPKPGERAAPVIKRGGRKGRFDLEEGGEEGGAAGKRISRGGAFKGRGEGEKRRPGRLDIRAAMEEGEGEGFRTRSIASIRRAREKEKRQVQQNHEVQKVIRDVTIPEVITVQELANRMAERSGDVIKKLMQMGVMATITQSIDGDTAEIVATEFGHRVHRVAEADIEMAAHTEADGLENMKPRAPVVTVMGHVDHGKTSLLDALRQTDVVSGEAGGITQHIGAYQVTLTAGAKITFIDTPGHAAFTEMRARGANVTDIVILVVAADDGIMPQTIEAINHAQAAKVPIIVAINKIDLPGANPDRVKQGLLQHGLVVESMGGDVLCIEVSAKAKKNLDKLEEAILLQAEVLNLTANPDRTAEGVVVEAKQEKGRGAVATVLIQKGTLHVGDIFVAGAEWGRVRALKTDRGTEVTDATPAMPVEVLGLNGTPLAGDDFVVLPDEAKARQISEFRQRKRREAASVAVGKTTMEQMLKGVQTGGIKELPVIIKGDVQGSVEAIAGALKKLVPEDAEVKVNIIQSAVGPINEGDITLANASKALVVGFNVRANPQAREMAKRDGIEIRYYSIIYNILDDIKALLSGMLAPTIQEKFLGYAEVRQVFNISKVGKVAGCMVTDGVVKRGAGVRLLRDNVVIHQGKLKTLKHLKDEIKEAREGYECGMAFENYDDIKVGDRIECYEVETIARSL